MTRLLWSLLLVASTACAQPAAQMPPMPYAGPPGFPDVSGGRVAIISMKETRGKTGELDIGPEPTLGERFKRGSPDRVIVGEPDGWMADLDAYRRVVKPASEVMPKATVRLSSLQGTSFERMTLLGYLPGGGLPQGPWTAVQRLFATASGELVLLKEYDFGLDGGGVVMFDEMLNTKVGASRATIKVTKTGEATQTIVSWVSGTRRIELLAVCKLVQGCADPDDWREIASSLPAAPTSKAQ